MNKSIIRFCPIVLISSLWGAICLANVSGLIQKESGMHLPATDFRTLYAAAVTVDENRWDLLYPPVIIDKTPSSPMSPQLELQLSIRGVSGFVFAWLYPPTAAILFAPLSAFGFHAALHIWIILNWIIFTLMLIYLELEMNQLRIMPIMKMLVILLCGMSYAIWHGMKNQNLDFFLALLILLTLRALRNNVSLLPAASIVLMGVTKGFSIVWVPFLILWRKWKILLLCFVLTLSLLLVSAFAGCGLEPYKRFFFEIVPSAKRFLIGGYNEGLPVLLSGFGLSDGLAIALSNWFLLFVCAFLYTKFAAICQDGLCTSLLLCITFFLFQISNNVCWTHYRVHLIAFVPTVLSGCGNMIWLRLLAFVGFAVNLLPIRNLLLTLTHTPFECAPPLVANFGTVCYLFLLIVMFLILHARLHFENKRKI